MKESCRGRKYPLYTINYGIQTGRTKGHVEYENIQREEVYGLGAKQREGGRVKQREVRVLNK